ncbi:hypothetical protein PMAYCL1PPCAC_24035, partial [Pristionchus mayeri]
YSFGERVDMSLERLGGDGGCSRGRKMERERRKGSDIVVLRALSGWQPRSKTIRHVGTQLLNQDELLFLVAHQCILTVLRLEISRVLLEEVSAGNSTRGCIARRWIIHIEGKRGRGEEGK